MNIIANRVAEFLKNYPPFQYLKIEDLAEISEAIRVINLEKHKTLFQINDALHDSFYVVASGAINLLVISDADETLLNRCMPGDIFGLRPFFARNNYMMTAKAREESVVYAIPISVFKPFVAKNSKVLDYLLESFATNTRNPEDKENSGKLVSDTVMYSEQQSEIQYFQALAYNKTPLIAQLSATAQQAAQMMTDNLMDAVIIARDNFPLAIISDADFRSKIVTGRFSNTITLDKVISSPLITVSENVSLAEAQLLLLKHNVSHLCVTQDGSESSAIKGIISQRDLISAQSSNPGLLIKAIKRSQRPEDLKNIRKKLTELIQTSIDKNIPLPHINNIASEINLGIIRRAIELSILELGSPPARFAWLSIGSQGRKEQLLLTDQDSILVFEDVAAENYRDVKNYFLRLASKATAVLQHIGYSFCPNSHMANNILWCKSLTDWTNQYASWMNAPRESNEISSIFFDFELAAGETKIEEALTEVVSSNLRKNSLFFDYLGNDALKKPSPLTFFKNFSLEEDGEHKDKFDIKTRAIMPLVDGARLMVLSHNIKGITNTWLRFKQLVMTEPKYADIYLNCAEAFLTLSKIRTQEGLKNDSNGQYINLNELAKADREKLKNALGPMKDLEDLIKGKFRLTQFS